MKYMRGGGHKILDHITINLRNSLTNEFLPISVDVYDNSLSRKWLTALNDLLKDEYHLEKNYCFFGFAEHQRNSRFIISEINKSITGINESNLDYNIDDFFTYENTVNPDLSLIHDRTNHLHRYFEDLQGTSGQGGQISNHYNNANDETKWHIRQLNLLCHELESQVLSERKVKTIPEWQRPSQLMCWMSAPRFNLDEEDYEYFGIDTLARPMGGVFVGVNKAVGKHHWEVFQDEGRDSRIDELTTTSMRAQTQAAGDFDIEWARNVKDFEFFQRDIKEFKEWLITNGFNPEDKSLTIGHPQVGQVNLVDSFKTDNYEGIWKILNQHLDVFSIKTSDAYCEYPYSWADDDYMQQQIRSMK